MTTRKERKEQLRAQRLEAERRAREAARRRLWIGYGAAGVLGAAVIAGVVIVVASGGGSSSGSDGGAFGPHYEGLQDRIAAAGASTMADPASSTHIHPRLAVYANGKQIEVPANVGIPPGQSPGSMAGLHTHDPTGTIHDEGMPPGATLGQFFEIWGVRFSRTELGPYRAGGKVVRMWVDGRPSRAYESLGLEDGQQIVVAYGALSSPPPPAVNSSG